MMATQMCCAWTKSTYAVCTLFWKSITLQYNVQKFQNKIKLAILLCLTLALLMLTGCSLPTVTEDIAELPLADAVPETEKTVPEEERTGPIIEPQAIADYLFTYGKLPDNFITKKEAQELGWDSTRNYVSDVAPGKSIGGDRFGNYEGVLPKVKGRTYYEADCYYTKGKRTAERIVYSSDGHVWYTEDHYVTFTELFPSGQEE